MDELDIKGKKYISSKRAAELTGYAKDYIGQLARAGKIVGTRMGRAWYVEKASLMTHAKADAEASSLLSPIQPVRPQIPRQFVSSSVSFPSSWSPATYSSDDSDLLPKPIKTSPSDSDSEVIRVRTSGLSRPIDSDLASAIRIKILEERSRYQQVPVQKTKFRIAEKANVINKKRTSQNHVLALGALSAALVVFVFFSSGFFFSSEIQFTGPERVSTANVLAGWQYFQDVVGQLPPFVQGLHTLQSFFTTLQGSFTDFFSKGADFIFSLFQQAK